MKLLSMLLLVGACATAETTTTNEQALCTIEDQQAGTCPPTSGIVADAVDYTETNYGTAEAHSAQCQRDGQGWRCTVKLDFLWGWVQTTCTANGVCWSVTHQNAAAAPDDGFCSEGDPNCGDPGGGGGPGDGPDVAATTEGHADSVALHYQQSGYSLTHRTVAACQPGERSCLVTLDFGSFTINVTCFDFGPPTGVSCWSRLST